MNYARQQDFQEVDIVLHSQDMRNTLGLKGVLGIYNAATWYVLSKRSNKVTTDWLQFWECYGEGLQFTSIIFIGVFIAYYRE